MRRIPEGFARIEFLPAELAIRVTERIVGFRIIIIRGILGRSSRFAGQLRRQGFGILRRHWQLRVDRVKDKQPLILDLDLVPASISSARKVGKRIFK